VIKLLKVFVLICTHYHVYLGVEVDPLFPISSSNIYKFGLSIWTFWNLNQKSLNVDWSISIRHYNKFRFLKYDLNIIWIDGLKLHRNGHKLFIVHVCNTKTVTCTFCAVARHYFFYITVTNSMIITRANNYMSLKLFIGLCRIYKVFTFGILKQSI